MNHDQPRGFGKDAAGLEEEAQPDNVYLAVGGDNNAKHDHDHIYQDGDVGLGDAKEPGEDEDGCWGTGLCGDLVVSGQNATLDKSQGMAGE